MRTNNDEKEENTMNYYGGTITVAGRDLITSLLSGETIEFTRIVVGSGKMPEGVEPIDMTELVNPIAEGTSTVPTVENGALYLTVEYRNDLNGGLQEGFWLSEFGIFAKTEASEEVLLYYATLGDSPQPVNAYQDNRIDIRRYPVTIALELDADVQVTYNPGSFVTAEEAQSLIDAMLAQKLESIGTAVVIDITIPATGWTWEDFDEQEGIDYYDEYRYHIDVPVAQATESQYPDVSLHKSSLEIAREAGLCPTVQTLSGAIRFWACNEPTADMSATLALLTSGATGSGGSASGGAAYVLPIATKTTLGGIKIGAGLSAAADGTVSVASTVPEEDIATSTDTEAMLDEIFSSDE